MSTVVHRFLAGVRKIQSVIRSFIACKRAKVIALAKIFHRLEHVFIRKKLEQRKEKLAASLANKKNLDKELQKLDFTMLKEMKEKEREWQKIHEKMTKIVDNLKETGVIADESPEDVIENYRVPCDLRDELLAAVIEKAVIVHPLLFVIV